MRRTLLGVTSTLLLVVACSDLPSSPSDATLPVTLAGTSFRRVPVAGAAPEAAEAQVPYTVANHGSAPVEFYRCHGRVQAALDRWDGERWVQRTGHGCNGLPVWDTTHWDGRLAPGTVGHDTTSVWGEPGTYRLRLLVVSSEPPDVVYSPAFRLR